MSIDGWIAVVLFGPAGLAVAALAGREAWAEAILWLEFRACRPPRDGTPAHPALPGVEDGSGGSQIVVDAVPAEGDGPGGEDR